MRSSAHLQKREPTRKGRPEGVPYASPWFFKAVLYTRIRASTAELALSARRRPLCLTGGRRPRARAAWRAVGRERSWDAAGIVSDGPRQLETMRLRPGHRVATRPRGPPRWRRVQDLPRCLYCQERRGPHSRTHTTVQSLYCCSPQGLCTQAAGVWLQSAESAESAESAAFITHLANQPAADQNRAADGQRDQPAMQNDKLIDRRQRLPTKIPHSVCWLQITRGPARHRERERKQNAPLRAATHHPAAPQPAPRP